MFWTDLFVLNRCPICVPYSVFKVRGRVGADRHRGQSPAPPGTKPVGCPCGQRVPGVGFPVLSRLESRGDKRDRGRKPAERGQKTEIGVCFAFWFVDSFEEPAAI